MIDKLIKLKKDIEEVLLSLLGDGDKELLEVRVNPVMEDIELYLQDGFIWISQDRVKALMDDRQSVNSYASGLIDRLKAPIIPGMNAIYNTTDLQKESYVRLLSLLYDLMGSAGAKRIDDEVRNRCLNRLAINKFEKAHHYRMLANEIKRQIISQWEEVAFSKKVKKNA